MAAQGDGRVAICQGPIIHLSHGNAVVTSAGFYPEGPEARQGRLTRSVRPCSLEKSKLPVFVSSRPLAMRCKGQGESGS
jgi:hypothetical protein